MRNYTRWIKRGSTLEADILGDRVEITAFPESAKVVLELDNGPDNVAVGLTPDEARLYGVRLIEGAALADGERAIRDEAS